ncbi:DUF4265 domain-containing protein [Actinoallomurus sp. NPDC052308]|uniref:DUF4265 domain-containing protein n=1 Tax=Actinoallomurus sp. NPDC052308 TaxID=3155530 RepID=UPI003441190B
MIYADGSIVPSPPVPVVHVKLFVDTSSSGKLVYEVLPALKIDVGIYELLGSPGFALGCAAGDTIRCSPDGRFTIEVKSGNHCVQIYAGRPIPSESLEVLARAVVELNGKVEWPSNRRFAVITLPPSVAISKIESALDSWAAGVPNAQWWFGN